MLASLTFSKSPLHFAAGCKRVTTCANLVNYNHLPDRLLGCVAVTLPSKITNDRRWLLVQLPLDIRFVSWLKPGNQCIDCLVDVPDRPVANCEIIPYRLMPDCIYYDCLVRIESMGMLFTRTIVGPAGQNVSEFIRAALPGGWEALCWDDSYRFTARIRL